MRSSVIACLVFFLASCGGPKKELLPAWLPADSVLSRDEMINVMVDVQLAEASLNLQKSKGNKNMPQLTREYYQWLYRKYHMSQRRFKDNLNYYEMDPENFSKMYEEVLKNLTEKSAKLKGPGKI